MMQSLVHKLRLSKEQGKEDEGGLCRLLVAQEYLSAHSSYLSALIPQSVSQS